MGSASASPSAVFNQCRHAPPVFVFVDLASCKTFRQHVFCSTRLPASLWRPATVRRTARTIAVISSANNAMTTTAVIQPQPQPPFHIHPLPPQPHTFDAPPVDFIFETNDALAAGKVRRAEGPFFAGQV
jgi:hypothetical protein